jgi:hypothetical protein
MPAFKKKTRSKELDIKIQMQKQSLKKKRQKRRKPFARQRMGMSRDNALARSICDPFNYSGCIPDGSKGPVCFTIKEEIQIGTGAAGSACGVASTPQPAQYKYVDNGSTATTATVTGNWGGASQLTTIVNTYYKYRPVSGGIRTTYTGPTNTDGGTLILGQIASGNPITNFNGDSLNGLANESEYYEVLSQRAGGQITWRPSDMDDMANFLNINSTVTAASVGTAQPTLFAWVFGATSSQTQQTVEIIWHYEGIVVNPSFGGGNWGTNQTPAEPGWYERTMNLISGVKPITSLVNNGLDLANGLGRVGVGVRSLRSLGSGMPMVTGISKSLALGWY